MPGSYRLVHYGLRPAKAIERRMLCVACERLYPFQRVEGYRYIGFGSIYFSDFQLVHRELGITDMLSIEKDVEAKACFRFNRPFKCIRLKFASSGEVLPTVSWRRRSIVWLDYDSRLSTDVLADIATVCLRAASGSLLIVTVNAQADAEPSKEGRDNYQDETGKAFDLDEYRLRIARTLLGEQLPAGVSGASLRGQELGKVFCDAIRNTILEQLSIRNVVLEADRKLHFKQLFNFRYKDGAQMATFGGILHQSSDERKVAACGFDNLPFIRTGVEPFSIKAPCLTQREIRHLNGQLPTAGSLHAPGVPEEDVKRYAEVYRYFPAFSEVLFA